MHKDRYEYTCDNCGETKEYASRPAWPKVFIDVVSKAGVDKAKLIFEFCSDECQGKWLKEHGLEGE